MAVDLSERRVKVWLLYLKHMRGDRGRLNLNILREVCSFLHLRPNLLVDVTNSYIRFFDFQKETWKQKRTLKPHIQADGDSSWVVLEGGSVFICGGRGWGIGTTTAYVVGEGCAEQARMQAGRYGHGVLAYSNQVYVFGGYNEDYMDHCEKYDLQQHTWTDLPRMQEPRAFFNPCLFNGSIYLCGCPSSLLEALSPQTDQMLPFQLTMPVEDSNCCMYVENNLLVVHLNRLILKYRAGLTEQLVQTSTSSTQQECLWQNSQPVVNTALRRYYIVNSGKCYSVDMDTGVWGPAIDQGPPESCVIA